MGGEIHTDCRAVRLITEGWQVKALETANSAGEQKTFEGDYFFSTAASAGDHALVRRGASAKSAGSVRRTGLSGFHYCAACCSARSRSTMKRRKGKQLIRDNWIYIQEPDVQLGRLQVFNNWSPFMVADSANVWLGLEYFCNQSDEIWNLSDERMVALATEELSKIAYH